MKTCSNSKSLRLFFFFLADLIERKCLNIFNIYYSQKELKHFDLEILVLWKILGYFEP